MWFLGVILYDFCMTKLDILNFSPLYQEDSTNNDNHGQDHRRGKGFVKDGCTQKDGNHGVDIGIGTSLGGRPLGQDVNVAGIANQGPKENKVDQGPEAIGGELEAGKFP